MKKKHRNVIVAKMLKSVLDGPYFMSADEMISRYPTLKNFTDGDRLKIIEAYSDRIASLEKWIQKTLAKNAETPQHAQAAK